LKNIQSNNKHFEGKGTRNRLFSE